MKRISYFDDLKKKGDDHMKQKILVLGLVIVLLFTQIPLVGFAKEYEESDSKLLSGKRISIMGDGISTYMGWNDSNPLTSEKCTYRYGTPYYGPKGSNCRNEELHVEDTWWHQATTELGAEILANNSGDSTGLLQDFGSANGDLEGYMQDMLAYKTRPYFLGAGENVPDIIALYVGTNDVEKATVDQIGTIDQIDFDALIVQNEDGTYTYGNPATVAEAYCIMLHKVTVTYPEAEVYCFTVLPSLSNEMTMCSTQLSTTYAFNDMIKSVAEHYDIIIVDLFERFALDPDKDGIVVQEDLDVFQSYFGEDAYPNASGFDMISESFVDTIVKNSKYIVSVEATAGTMEQVGVTVSNKGNAVHKGAKDFVTENGMHIDYQSSADLFEKTERTFKETYSATDETGNYQTTGGKEKIEKNTVPNCEIEIPIAGEARGRKQVDDSKNTVFGRPIGTLNQTGDLKTSDQDGVYDYLETRVDQQGRMEVRTQSVSVTEHISFNNHKGMQYLQSNTVPTKANHMITGVTPVQIPKTEEEVPGIAPNYEYVYIGSDKLSNFWAAYAYNEPDNSAYPDETPIYEDEENQFYVGANHSVFTKRKLVVPKLYLENKTIEGKFPARYDSVQQFTLTNADGQAITTYCADQKTAAIKGFSYRLANIEDSTYYSKAEAEMIQTIVRNGYWGTESGFGSLESFKQIMKESGVFSDSEIANITDGIAMTAMQYAIWTYSNCMDNKTFINAYYTNRLAAPSSAADDESAALIFKLYHYLTHLAPVKEEVKTTGNTLINEDNFLKAISFDLVEKQQSHSNNQDADPLNDVYKANLTFELKVKPSTENGDDLVLMILDGKTEIAKGRIAGKLQPGEVQLVANEKGTYTFNNIEITEGTQNVRFVLCGTQNLEKDAYLLTSENRDGEESQTMVGVVEGNRGVNVEMNICFVLSIEDEITSTERVWRTEERINGKVQVHKVNSKDHNEKLSGAVFELYVDENKNGVFDLDVDSLYGTLVSTTVGTYELDGLGRNGYFLVEAKAPNGFLKDNRHFYFEISENGDVVDVENETGIGFTNEPVPVSSQEVPASPSTGDNTNIGISMFLIIKSLFTIFVLLFVKKKRGSAV